MISIHRFMSIYVPILQVCPPEFNIEIVRLDHVVSSQQGFVQIISRKLIFIFQSSLREMYLKYSKNRKTRVLVGTGIRICQINLSLECPVRRRDLKLLRWCRNYNVTDKIRIQEKLDYKEYNLTS